MSEFPKAEASNKSKEEIYSLAGALFAEHKLEPGFDIHTFAKDQLGAEIKYEGLDEWEKSQDASITVEGPENFKIRISKFTGILRDRFSIAHEIGHYVLHSNYGEKKIEAARFGSNQIEWEANWFAAGFLMPTEHFKKLYSEEQDAFHLASKFLVSMPAIHVRIETYKQYKY